MTTFWKQSDGIIVVKFAQAHDTLHGDTFSGLEFFHVGVEEDGEGVE